MDTEHFDSDFIIALVPLSQVYLTDLQLVFLLTCIYRIVQNSESKNNLQSMYKNDMH